MSMLTVAGTLLAVEPPATNKKTETKSEAKTDAKVDKLTAAEDMLKPVPRAPKPALPPSKLPLELVQGERIALIGNSTAERMSLFGYFETFLQLRFPDKELVVHNFARPADEVNNRQRATDYTKLDDPLFAFNPDTFFCFFGYNESYAGAAGVEQFKKDYENFIDLYTKSYPRDDAHSHPRFVLISPIAFEATGDPLLPSGVTENANLKLYTDAVKAVAEKRKLAYVDLYVPTAESFAREPGAQYTINGVHENEKGDKLIGELLDLALFDSSNPAVNDKAHFEKLRAAIIEKSWMNAQDYRMVNGWYVYGGRRTWDTETFPREYVKLRNMVHNRDKHIWDIAQGKKVSDKIDDSKTGELLVPETRFGQARQKYSEDQEAGPRILPPDELIKTCTVPPGFEIKLFADETRFPEIAKPCQLTFDNKGRLWMSTMPSYPQWKPGDAPPSDKLVILEDTNNDGVADKSTVFYDKLHCPTGFEFFNGGVLVTNQPHLVWLKDTDGDDKADIEVTVLDGWATEDTHHTIGAFEFSPGGRLHMMEGVSMSTAVETPWGPFRNFGSSGCYVLDPRTWKISHYNTPGYGNPWCYVFNEWGQGFCGDGTGANQHWDTPLSSKQYRGRKGLNPLFPVESMRPVVGSEFLKTRQFPDDVQDQFIYACVINMNGMPRWSIRDEGAGYLGTRVRHDPNNPKTPYDLISSIDKHFRPVDPQIGPDGTLWFGDWANPLIGHMQYSQRDPNRDHTHGRVYRLIYKDKPLLTPVTQFGKSEAEVLNQLREYEWRTRYRARRELQNRDGKVVLPAVTKWVAGLDPNDKDFERLRCEALWIQESFHAVDETLLKAVLKSQELNARAAATRIAADERDYIKDAFALLTTASQDESERVRTEAVRGLSFFPNLESSNAIVNAVKGSKDYFLNYTVDAAMAANMDVWQIPYIKGDIVASKNPEIKKLLDTVIATEKKGAEAVPYLQILLGKDPTSAEQKNKAMQALADMKGGLADNGKEVFRRSCISCHRVGNEGADFAPNMTGVGKRLPRYKIVESIIDPNAEIDKKYLSTLIITAEGKSHSGLLVGETDKDVSIFDGKFKHVIPVDDILDRKTLNQSSMPEGMAATLSPTEFLDIVQYLSTLTQDPKPIPDGNYNTVPQ
jgi:putative heme-binding domain-containing protein